MAKKLSWLGPYGKAKKIPKEITKLCYIESSLNKKVLKDAITPETLALWNFIGNPRGNLIPIGYKNQLFIGYQNFEYMRWFQDIVQKMWKKFNFRFQSALPIVPLNRALEAGLYDEECLNEQFPGPKTGNAPGYKDGSFKKRQIGGWRWFSLIVDDENWTGESWIIEKEQEKLELKEQIKEKVAPKFYMPIKYVKGKWTEDKEGIGSYVKPAECTTIPRRYSVPSVEGSDATNLVERYENFINTILKKLKTQWTLNVWNIIDFDYQSLNENAEIVLKPEIYLDLGWIETYALGEKEWGEIGKGLHRHFKEVFSVRVGLSENSLIDMILRKKSKLNPYWDGSAYSLTPLIIDVYSKLVDIATTKLLELIELNVS
ncbi:MAG: hypothetical protein GF383_08885 [Candidatus Lokiarchaeota archaeon]|nr:hypothetical protein [Candidatus Lokiarchaeota archaeon]MBD3340502.1 hypothetical protein [Candidatus Lokiarchaeota archaeon]